MPKLKVLSGADLIRIFEGFGFQVAVQRGSHVKLSRLLNNDTRQTLTIPNHSEIDKGTLKAIYR
jgi:predicted RNA binding protein YcfA (HicA-like mRNA interferase family)